MWRTLFTSLDGEVPTYTREDCVEVDARSVKGLWVRHVPHGTDLLGRGLPPADGRCQRGEDVGGLYLADMTITAGR